MARSSRRSPRFLPVQTDRSALPVTAASVKSKSGHQTDDRTGSHSGTSARSPGSAESPALPSTMHMRSAPYKRLSSRSRSLQKAGNAPPVFPSLYRSYRLHFAGIDSDEMCFALIRSNQKAAASDLAAPSAPQASGRSALSRRSAAPSLPSDAIRTESPSGCRSQAPSAEPVSRSAPPEAVHGRPDASVGILPAARQLSPSKQ